MFKNIIIVILTFLLCSLLFQNKKNVDILIGDMAETTEKVVNGTIYLKRTFDDKFADKKFDIDSIPPSLNLQKEPMIREETFFDEK